MWHAAACVGGAGVRRRAARQLLWRRSFWKGWSLVGRLDDAEPIYYARDFFRELIEFGKDNGKAFETPRELLSLEQPRFGDKASAQTGDGDATVATSQLQKLELQAWRMTRAAFPFPVDDVQGYPLDDPDGEERGLRFQRSASGQLIGGEGAGGNAEDDENEQGAESAAAPPALAKVVTVAFRDSGIEMIPGWMERFTAQLGEHPNVRVEHVVFIERRILKPLYRYLMTRTKMSVPEAWHAQALMCFGDFYKFTNHTKIPNRLSGYVFVLDQNNNVRWRACGNADDEEAEAFVNATMQVLVEGSSEGSNVLRHVKH